STTWALVRICPSFSMMTPEPTMVSNRRCGFALLIFMAWIATTLGETRSKTTVSGSEHDSAAAVAGPIRRVTSASQGRMTVDHTPRARTRIIGGDASVARRHRARPPVHRLRGLTVHRERGGDHARQRPEG